MSSHRVAVIGDVQVELLGKVSGLSFTEVNADVLRPASLELVIGGTAVNFARAATAHFGEVHLIGRTGNDALAQLIETELCSAGLVLHLARDAERPSGLTAVIRDDNPANARGSRLLLVGQGSANAALTVAEILQHRSLLEQLDALVVDGYAMLDEPRRSACLEAMAIVHHRGGVVLFDVVPHDSHLRYGLDELRALAAHATIVVVEVRTLLGFIGMQPAEAYVDLAATKAALPVLRRALPDKVLYLRFGYGNADESLRAFPDGRLVYRRTGYAQTPQPAGFGDELTAAELAEHLPDLRRLVRSTATASEELSGA